MEVTTTRKLGCQRGTPEHLAFNKICEVLRQQGVKTPARAVPDPSLVVKVLAPSCKSRLQMHLEPYEIPDHGLWRHQPVYGLNDAPCSCMAVVFEQ